MTSKQLKAMYRHLVKRVSAMDVYDGRGRGVDVYTCKECGYHFFTRYKDKGVTPFTVRCRQCGNGTCTHEKTLTETIAATIPNAIVHNWVRPSFDWLERQRKKDNIGVIEHVLNGGLVIEDE